MRTSAIIWTVASAVILAIPLPSAARPHRDGSTSKSFSYSLTVNSDCALSLGTARTIAFSVSNPVKTNCETDGAMISIYAKAAHIRVCRVSKDSSPVCYTNTDDPAEGLPVENGIDAFNMYGRLRAHGADEPATYRETVTVALTFN